MKISDTNNLNKAWNAFAKGDYETAISIYENLANKGYGDAQYNLGLIYELIKGNKQDLEKAKTLYEKSCDSGVQNACIRYGSLKNY